ncbi:DNA/RNA polymerase [Massarina eburnea CBS 473.64]|uniref:DNA-directed RNA polymerase n=1 Tax=Massarina eburnea CBS 473.64 TaxID=1395130 RepID=A0A6A6SF66_9PLEO|nr:DNA/RNA polymerase [Massarina eburnea CBS 473.64]
MPAGTSNSGWLQASVIRRNMLSKGILPGDEELGKKDDDHKPGAPSRYMPLWSSVKKPMRWRRRRILLFVVGLLFVYLFVKNIPDLGVENGRRQPDPYGFDSVISPPETDEKYSRADDKEPTGAPPGTRAPRPGEVAPHTFDGPVKFYKLAPSLHGAAHTNGYRSTNRNVLFAISSLKSASSLLPVICEMSRWSRSWVHAAFMGRDDIDLAKILEINGIDQIKCPAIWHDARPDYAEYSTNARAESAVMSALTHIHSFLHPQAAITDHALAEDDFFIRGMRAKMKVLDVPLIEGPKNWDSFMWMTRLDSGSLKAWNEPTVEILIQTPPHSSSIIRLLKSIKGADYSGVKLPHITIELPTEIDDSVRMYLEHFKWPSDSDHSQISIRRRITSQHATQEDSAIRFLELFYPTSAKNSHVLFLSPQAELSVQYYQYIMYVLMEYKYSSFGAVDSSAVMGISLELPSTLLDGKSKLVRPKIQDMHTGRYEELYPGTPSVPFLWQAPNSHATLFFGDKWAELHSFLSNRVAKHHQAPKATTRHKLVSESLPSWVEYMLEFMRARGYSLFYPGASTMESLVTIHNELYRAPEEFRQAPQNQDNEAKEPTLPNEAFLRAEEAAAPPKNAEPTMIPHSRPLHEALPFEGDLPEIPHLPYLLHDGQQISQDNASTTAAKYAEKYRSVIGGCKMPKGRHRKQVSGSAKDLFCFGDESESEWEFDDEDDDGPAMMLARATQRKLRRDGFRSPTQLAEQLTLPWLCPGRMRWAASGAPLSALSNDVRKPQSLPSLSPRLDTRSLATAADVQPAPMDMPFNSFMPWSRRIQPPGLARLEPWDPHAPLMLRQPTVLPTTPMRYGIGGDPTELYQNLHACLRVGRMDRATAIIERLTRMYNPSAPEVVEAHNVFLQTMFEQAEQNPTPESMAEIEKWYDSRMLRHTIEPSSDTFVTLLRASMALLEGPAKKTAIQKYLQMAQEYGAGMVEEINNSEDLSDSEWDTLIRFQPEMFKEPPPIETLATDEISTPLGHASLVEHGILPNPAHHIKGVQQKGLGLETLKQSLHLLDHVDAVSYPHEMEATAEEKDRAYAYARQLRLEKDSMEAALQRWKAEDEKMTDFGVPSVVKSKPIQAMMWHWYSALLPLVKKELAICKTVLADPNRVGSGDDRHVYGAYFEACNPEKAAALTVSRVIQHCARGSRDDINPLKVSILTTRLGDDVEEEVQAAVRAKRKTMLRKQRKLARQHLLSTLNIATDNAKTGQGSQTPIDPKSTIDPHPDKALNIAMDIDKTSTRYPLNVRTKIGAVLIELLLQSAKLTVTAQNPKTGKTVSCLQPAFHHRQSFINGKKVGIVAPHSEIETKLRTEPVHSITTQNLPMVYEPKPWTSLEEGGYYSNKSTVIRSKGTDPSQRAYANSAIAKGDMDKVFAGLDVLGRVPWQINKGVFEVMAECWNTGEGIGGMVAGQFRAERPVEPAYDASSDERSKWMKKLKEWENERMGAHSQRCFQNFQLDIARAYLKEPRIFFPHSVDFRGRAYPVPPLLNHIGADFARGLLRFANGKELGTVGLQWVKIQLANLYGFDKASLREREQFTMDNLSDVYDSAANPLTGRRWWVKAEDPWQCLACCMELKNALDSPDPTRYISHLPIHQDGTCNGLQHYAALGGDHAGASQVNLEPSDRPQDIYSGVADLVREMVVADAAEGNVFAQLVKDKITRKVVKRTVMTNVYGVTFMGAKLQVLDELKTIFPNFEADEKIVSLQKPALYIAVKIFTALGKIFNGAQEIQYWLVECGDRITTSISPEQIRDIRDRLNGDPTFYSSKYKKAKTGIPRTTATKTKKISDAFKTSIIWTTPLKMPVVQPYRKDVKTVVKTKLQIITVGKSNAIATVDKRKQLQAFPPNFIHSLDASHMLLSAIKCGELGLDFAAVHDSFWTHAADIPTLNVILRDAFVRMHSEDIMGRLAAEFSTRYAGSMYCANVIGSSAVGRKIAAWRKRDRNAQHGSIAEAKHRSASFEEVALEARRQELLNSEDPELRKEGEVMVTPTSIWLANQDPKAMASLRLALLGETKQKGPGKFDEIKDKVLTEEIASNADTDIVAADMDADAEDLDDFETDLETDPDAEAQLEDTAESSSEIDLQPKKAPKVLSPRSQIQVWLPLTFPPVPQKGSWDVSRLRESKYFFS